MTFRFRHMIAAVLTAALVSAFLSPAVLSKEDAQGKKGQAQDPNQAAMQAGFKRWVDCCRLGPPHQHLARLLGKWDLAMSVMQPGTDTVVSQSKGKAENRWMVEGRWLISEADYPMMLRDSKNFMIIGYDPFKQRYVSSSISSAHNMMLHAEGATDQTGSILFYGKMDEPVTNEHDKVLKTVFRFPSPDRHVIEVHELSHFEGKTLVLKFDFTRAKADGASPGKKK